MQDLNGLRVMVTRTNGQVCIGTASGPLPWLTGIGQYYEVLMDAPIVHHWEPVKKNLKRQKYEDKDETDSIMTSYGMYEARRLTIV